MTTSGIKTVTLQTWLLTFDSLRSDRPQPWLLSVKPVHQSGSPGRRTRPVASEFYESIDGARLFVLSNTVLAANLLPLPVSAG